MVNPVELALSSLLPTVSFLPFELIDLSTSLLAQSRTKAASLKPEEEIGRIYACCHIACQRLGHKLALEIAKPTPPVKPKVYNKLHTYLNSVLRTTATPRTPNANRTEDKLQRENASKPTRGDGNAKVTPTKAVSSTTSGKRATASRQSGEANVPSFVMPLIRQLCKAFGKPEAAPHVFVGTSSVLKAAKGESQEEPPAKKRKTSTKSNASETIRQEAIPALVVTLFTVISNKMHGQADDEDSSFPTKAVGVTREYCMENASRLPFDFDETTSMKKDIKRFSDEAEDNWPNMEWYENVPSLEATADAAGDDDEDIASDEALTPNNRPSKTPLRRREKRGTFEEDTPGAAGLLPGLGTMFQPPIDWLSEERRAEYAVWKKNILQQAAIVDQEA